jgi:hypothetical protein
MGLASAFKKDKARNEEFADRCIPRDPYDIPTYHDRTFQYVWPSSGDVS